MIDLKQLEDYQTAELIAAKVSAVLSLFYVRNSNVPTGDFLSDVDEDDDGKFIQELSPGMASVVPNRL